MRSAKQGRLRPLALQHLALFLLMTLLTGGGCVMEKDLSAVEKTAMSAKKITLFLAGDVMTGRGIDQVLAHPSDPVIFEPYMRSAYGYVQLAEKKNGPLRKPVDDGYIWGDALAVLEKIQPDLRIINLETSVTKSDEYWPGKGINYRMHPGNIGCLTAARLDCCVLANNHVLDWGHAGLVETLAVLQQAKIQSAGAGRDRRQSQAPAVLQVSGKGRVLIFAYATDTCGVPPSWAGRDNWPGVNLLTDLSAQTVARIKEDVAAIKQPGDVALVSIHWGGNWGYALSPMDRHFAHSLIDEAAIDVIYGHSSHHAKGIEVYQDRLILYGCGDFLNDYEGIGGYEEYRGDLSLMYFPSFAPSTGRFVEMRLFPMQIRGFQTVHAAAKDSTWLLQVLNREGKQLGTRLLPARDGSFLLEWD